MTSVATKDLDPRPHCVDEPLRPEKERRHRSDLYDCYFDLVAELLSSSAALSVSP